MPNTISRLLIILSLCASGSLWANDPLCPPPVANTVTPKSQVSGEEFHQAMALAVASGEKLDWVEDKNANACGGYYQIPFNPSPDTNKTPDESAMNISADNLEHHSNGLSIFDGNVEVYQGGMRFRCDKFSYSQQASFAELENNIQFRQDGMLLLADKMTINGQQKTAKLNNAQFLLSTGQLRGSSEKMAFDNKQGGHIQLQNTRFTACPPDQEHWAISSDELVLNQEQGWGTAKDAWFYIEEVPVMYFPYLDFPIDDRRKTGILMPTISSSAGGGLDIGVPIYFNLAPNYDMTYTPRYNHDHGLLNALEGRYKNTYSEWAFTGTYIHDDKIIGDTPTVSDDDNSRWLAGVQEEGRFNKNWSTLIDYTAVSDIHYFRDWGNVGLDIQKTLNIKRQAQLNYASKHWLVQSSLVDYQPLEQQTNADGSASVKEEDYRHWPRMNIFHHSAQKAFSFNPIYNAQYTYFNHEQLNRAHRIYNAPGITFPMRWQAIHLLPSAQIRRTDFSFVGMDSDSHSTDAEIDGSEDITVASFSLDSLLFLERTINNVDGGLIHTLTPRLYYLFNDYQEGQDTLQAFDTSENAFSYQQMFRASRFSSYDRIDDANQVTLALETELLSAQHGQTLLFLGIGQTQYFRDREVVINSSDNDFLLIEDGDSPAGIAQKNAQNRLIDKKYYRRHSDIALTTRWQLNEQQQISGNLLFDPDNHEGEEGSVFYHIQHQTGALFNAGYRYKKQLPLIIPIGTDGSTEEVLFNNNSNQLDLSFYLPVSRDWKLFARVNYDINKSEGIDNISGVEYGGCCFNVKLAYQNQRKTFNSTGTLNEYDSASYDHIWHIQFEFTGFGSVNDSLGRILEEQIQGYQRRD